VVPTIRVRKRRVLTTEVQLVTRQFGGGARAREVDRDGWLRPAAVRGALRFWWRALFGSRCGDLSSMRAAEERIFGSAAAEGPARPGAVAVSVQADEVPERALVQWKAGRGDALAGAYFPAQQSGGMGGSNFRPAARLLVPWAEGPKARLRLTAPSDLEPEAWEQVRRALQAWVVFGGSGARTRRAAGAVTFASAEDAHAVGGAASRDEVMAWLTDLPASGGAPGFLSTARRDGTLLAAQAARSGEEAQRTALEVWRALRQDRAHPRSWDGPTGWGRTRWPEADAVRDLAGTHAVWEDGTKHEPAPANLGKAPRAHLGLPIVLQYKDASLTVWRHGQRQPNTHRERGKLTQPEPGPHEIVSDQGDRYASPVLMSVVRVADDGPAQFAGVVLVTPSLLTSATTKQDRGTPLDPGPWAGIRDEVFERFTAAGFDRIDPVEVP